LIWPLGATILDGQRCRFHVWAPNASRVQVHLLDPQERFIQMTSGPDGYWQTVAEDVSPGARYYYRLENGDGESKDRPDPASRYQPEGVHGPSQVANPHFAWDDACWSGIPLQRYIFYELHVGTFTSEGTFEAVIPHLQELVDLGITAVEIMPVAQFPGSRNWGYDGVLPFAVQDSYGGPEGLKKLVDACHRHGLAVVMDVVYNHLGAEGNYLWDYGPYFTDRYKTAWGSSVNFDGPGSDPVRRYFIENALYWLAEFHIDALRLDAVHAILDFSAGTFLEELATLVERERTRLNRQVFLIAESDLNDPRVVRPRELFGFGLDAQWSDDFHHSLHTLLTGESAGYYMDFAAANGHAPTHYLETALRDGFVYAGQHSRFRERRHGSPPAGIPAYRMVVCTQNHDQIGNRKMGDRLSTLVSPARLKLAAGLLLLSPYLPLLFMGEEYGETNPFQYFVSHEDPALVEAVRKGRKEEFAAFMAGDEPPDPASIETFERSKLDRSKMSEGWHREINDLYRKLIGLRKTLPPLQLLSRDYQEVMGFETERVLCLRRWHGEHAVFAVFNFAGQPASVRLPLPAGRWTKRVATGETDGLQPGIESTGEYEMSIPAEAFVLYVKEIE
jgi:maltooligosyltrehalose trehalohydrolase